MGCIDINKMMRLNGCVVNQNFYLIQNILICLTVRRKFFTAEVGTYNIQEDLVKGQPIVISMGLSYLE